MSLNEIVLAAEESHLWAGVNPWVVGAVVLLIFLASMGVLVAFGGGREHS
ncbi:hypothetical protein [Nocardioides daphniae]|uniref:Uncharacterized protein n=1 Tax=Nocardioides daphniae TaxID=402297 RepID=A0ABQ1QJ40_9ACTN|nr:hypothetical protein [Nocardioides daphniae]GGD29571.1 hypothetical protein GCM10007231_31300 [Nocardioides daphniae]